MYTTLLMDGLYIDYMKWFGTVVFGFLNQWIDLSVYCRLGSFLCLWFCFLILCELVCVGSRFLVEEKRQRSVVHYPQLQGDGCVFGSFPSRNRSTSSKLSIRYFYSVRNRSTLK